MERNRDLRVSGAGTEVLKELKRRSSSCTPIVITTHSTRGEHTSRTLQQASDCPWTDTPLFIRNLVYTNSAIATSIYPNKLRSKNFSNLFSFIDRRILCCKNFIWLRTIQELKASKGWCIYAHCSVHMLQYVSSNASPGVASQLTRAVALLRLRVILALWVAALASRNKLLFRRRSLWLVDWGDFSSVTDILWTAYLVDKKEQQKTQPS